MNLKDSIYWQIFSDLWLYFKRCVEPERLDWSAAVDGAAELGHKYENTPQFEFVKELLFAVLDEIEKIRSPKNGQLERRCENGQRNQDR